MAFGSSANLTFDIFARDHTNNTFGKLSNQTGAFSGSLGKMGGVLRKVGGIMAATFAAQQVGGFFVNTVKQASDLNETINKSNIIFGENAKAIEKWAASASKSMGLSKQAALDSASSFGDMFSQIGFAKNRSADMSKQVVQMAVDFGSFNNLPTADVLDRISGAFRGEYDALQKVIPNISAARVQQVALNETGKTSVSTLTAQEKAHAALTIMQKDGARAMGDFARTSDGLANQQKILSAQFDNVKAKIGTALLPVATKLFQWMNNDLIPATQVAYQWLQAKLGPVFSWVGDTIKSKLIPFVQDIGDRLGKDLPGFVGQAKSAFKDAQPFFAAIGTVFSKVIGPALKWVADHLLPALGWAIRAVGKFWQAEGKVFQKVWEIMAPVFEQWGKAIRTVGKWGKWLWNNIFQPVFKFIISGVANVLEFWADMLDALSHVPGFGWAKDAADKMHGAADKADELANAIKKIPDKKVNVTVAYHYTGLQNNPGGPTRGRGDDTMPGGPAPRMSGGGTSGRFSTRNSGRRSSRSAGISAIDPRGMEIRVVGVDPGMRAFLNTGGSSRYN